MRNELRNTFGLLDGARIAGGCESCNAYQEVRAWPHIKGAWAVTICHDDDCLFLSAMRAR
jgi:hypothetical protein